MTLELDSASNRLTAADYLSGRERRKEVSPGTAIWIAVLRAYSMGYEAGVRKANDDHREATRPSL